jgi:hypothetical protein
VPGAASVADHPRRRDGLPRKKSGKTGTPLTRKTTTKPAGGTTPKPLIRAQQALDHAARTEKQLKSTLKKHTKIINTAKDDLDAHTADLKTSSRS